MDPWYCFDFEYNLKDEEDNSFDLCEISEIYPDGSWEINSSEYGPINFKNKRLGFLVFASFFMGFGLGVRVSFIAITIPIILSTVAFLILNNIK